MSVRNELTRRSIIMPIFSVKNNVLVLNTRDLTGNRIIFFLLLYIVPIPIYILINLYYNTN